MSKGRATKSYTGQPRLQRQYRLQGLNSPDQMLVTECALKNKLSIGDLPHREKSRLQDSYIHAELDQIQKMMRAPKKIIDVYNKYFNVNNTNHVETIFFMVAPSLINRGLPAIYRLAIVQNLESGKSDNYSISLHSIVNGKHDSFLFLARLDNKPDTVHVYNHKVKMGHPHMHLWTENPNDYQKQGYPEKVIPTVGPEELPEEIADSVSMGITHIMKMANIDGKVELYKKNMTIIEVAAQLSISLPFHSSQDCRQVLQQVEKARNSNKCPAKTESIVKKVDPDVRPGAPPIHKPNEKAKPLLK